MFYFISISIYDFWEHPSHQSQRFYRAENGLRESEGKENVSFHFSECLMHFKVSETSTAIIFVFHFDILFEFASISILFSYFNLKLMYFAIIAFGMF